jgi:Flp pilus assembly protein TadG
MPSTRWESTLHRDSGAVAVETAVVSMFLIILMFGIVESSFLFKDWLSVSAAARAGARMGASQPRVANFAQASADQVTNALSDLNPSNIQAVWVYKTTGITGSPPASCDSSSSCVPFTWNGSQLTTSSLGNWLSTSQDACAGDVTTGTNLRDSLGVYVKYNHTSPLGFFFNNSIISQSTVMWIEPWTADVHCKPGV